jgi:HD superfamily phosphohydrolase
MEFHDALHGLIRLGLPFNSSLLEDLLSSPEVGRMRNLRLMNFDVPLIQELGSAKRLPHSIGVCYLAQEIGLRSLKSQKALSTLMVAGLLHDAAIPPYGHLVEATLKKRNPDFDHSKILGQLLHGTYHETNSYHQIVPGRSLRLRSILDKYDIDPEKVLDLVRPHGGVGTAISAQVDLDNLDNVHRMARLVGWDGAQENLRTIVNDVQIDSEFHLTFGSSAVSALETWQDLRQRLYTMIIAHPEAVAQNSFQSDLVRMAIDSGVMSPENWYLNEPQFEERLRGNPDTRALADQLLAGSRYKLIDYVWFTSVGAPPCADWSTIFEKIEPQLPELNHNESYFSWVESGLISRKVTVNARFGRVRELGVRSSSCLIARVHTDAPGSTKPHLTKERRNAWRAQVFEVFGSNVGGWQGEVLFPEDFSGSYFRMDKNVKQLELC